MKQKVAVKAVVKSDDEVALKRLADGIFYSTEINNYAKCADLADHIAEYVNYRTEHVIDARIEHAVNDATCFLLEVIDGLRTADDTLNESLEQLQRDLEDVEGTTVHYANILMRHIGKAREERREVYSNLATAIDRHMMHYHKDVHGK